MAENTVYDLDPDFLAALTGSSGSPASLNAQQQSKIRSSLAFMDVTGAGNITDPTLQANARGNMGLQGRFCPPLGLSIVAGTEAAPNGATTSGYHSQAVAELWRSPIHATTEAGSLAVVYSHFYSNGTGSNLCNPLGTAVTTPITHQAAVEAKGASVAVADQPRVPLSFFGAVLGSNTSERLLISDERPYRMKQGSRHFIRTKVDSSAHYIQSSGFFALSNANSSSNDGRPFTGSGYSTTTASIADDGNTTNGASTAIFNPFAPLCILGRSTQYAIAPSLACVGDSIISGAGDSVNYTLSDPMFTPGFGARAALYAGIGWVNVGASGTKLSDWALAKNVYLREDLAAFAPLVLLAIGTNDIGSSTATMQSNMLSILTRYFNRYQNVIVCTILPKTSSTDDWYTYSNQSPYTSNDTEFQRRNWNRWLRDTSGSSSVSGETPQGLVNSSNTSFWTRFGFTGTPVVTVNGVGQTVTVVDSAGGNFTIPAPASGATVLVSYTKVAGAYSQINAIAPLGSKQWTVGDIASIVEKDSTGAAIDVANYNPSLSSAGYWPIAKSRAGNQTYYTGSITTAGTYVDSAQATNAGTYNGCHIKLTSGALSGTLAIIHGQSKLTQTPTYNTSNAATGSIAIGDTYKICELPTIDGVHPAPWIHDAIAADATLVAKIKALSVPIP